MYSSSSPDISGIDAKKAMIERMSPDQLRQFAMMNSNDLIAMSLVSSVQSMRNKAQQAQQAQQGGQQPKVVDQLVQSLPAEEAGLAALPADNMSMADGGIVGYAGGGEAYETPYDRMNREQRALDEQRRVERLQAIERGAGRSGDTTYSPSGEIYSSTGIGTAPDAKWPTADAMWEAVGMGNPENRRTREGLADFEKRKREGKLTDAEKRKLGMDVTAGAESKDAPRSDTEKAPLVGVKDQPRGLESLSASNSYRTSASGGAGAGAPMDMGALYRQAQTTAGLGTEVDPYAAQRSEILRSRQDQSRREEADVEQKAKGLEALSTKREARLGAREAELEAQGKTDERMAIINAGLTMMQSSGRGLAGIAEGAATGMKQYGESLKLSKAERQKIADARDAYDEFKFNADTMTQKERTAAKNKIDEAANLSSEKAIDAIAAERKVSREVAKELFGKTVDTQNSALDRASRERIANMQTAAMSARSGGSDKQQLAELKALQTNLQAQLKSTMPYGASKAKYAELQAQLAQVNSAVAKMAGLDTMGTGPGASTAPALKYNPTTGKIE